jgi:hypothetical protein
MTHKPIRGQVFMLGDERCDKYRTIVPSQKEMVEFERMYYIVPLSLIVKF